MQADTNSLGDDLPVKSFPISVCIFVPSSSPSASSQESVNAGACWTRSYWNLAYSGLGAEDSSAAAFEVVGTSPRATRSFAYASDAQSLRNAIAASLFCVRGLIDQ